MSKKNTRRKRQKKNAASPLFWMVGSGVLLIVAALALSFSGDSGGGSPVIAVDQEVIQYGDVKFNTNLTFEITVTNTGDEKLRFKEEPYIEVRDGC